MGKDYGTFDSAGKQIFIDQIVAWRHRSLGGALGSIEQGFSLRAFILRIAVFGDIIL